MGNERTQCMGCLKRRCKLSELALCPKCHADPKTYKIHAGAPKTSEEPTLEELDRLIEYMARPEHLPDWYLRDAELYNRGEELHGLEILLIRRRL